MWQATTIINIIIMSVNQWMDSLNQYVHGYILRLDLMWKMEGHKKLHYCDQCVLICPFK